MSEVKQLIEMTKKNADSIATLQKSHVSILDEMKKRPAAGHPSPGQVFGTPYVRTGENIMGSRGFSFLKMFGVLTGAVNREDAKIELNVHDRLNNVYVKELGNAGYSYGGGGNTGIHRFLAPLGTAYMQEQIVPHDFRVEMKALVNAGVAGANPDNMGYVANKMMGHPSMQGKALSWLNELAGGALVAPPEMGELIELLRNKEALVNAGAKTVPLPPQGRLKYPRQTSASTTFWVGENKNITNSEVGTGEVTLQAKKLAVLIKAPNELIRFASPAAEALLRDDMTKSLALGLDLAGLEGPGTDVTPRGLINMPNINTVTSSTPGANGDKLVGEDIYRMLAIVEESLGQFESWIMRPKMWYKYLQLRSDAVANGDGQGPFLFNLIREAGAGTAPTLAGFPVVTSTQVSQVRAKGNASNLSYVIGGMFSDLLIGMFGAIEFAATTMGDTAFQNDQTWVRGILSADIAARHESVFAFMDNIGTTI